VRLPLVGETGDLNPFESACVLAQNVDLTQGRILPRMGDQQLSTNPTRRVFVKGDGSVVASGANGYGFVWGNDVYLIDGENLWRKNGDSGTILQAPSAPTITSHQISAPAFNASSANDFNPAPSIFSTNGWCKWSMTASGWTTITVTLSTGGLNLSDYSALLVYVFLPDTYAGSFRVKIGGTALPVLERKQYAKLSSGSAYVVTFDLSVLTSRDNVTSIVFEYEADSNHDFLLFNGFRRLYNLLRGKHVYLATRTRDGIESPASEPYELPVLNEWYYSYGANITIGGLTSGDVVKLYRSNGERYCLAAQGTASGSTLTLLDKGDVGEPYVPSGVLPYGPATVWGNRVAVAQGQELYISAVGDPLRYSQGAINDLGDPYRIVLPSPIVALAVVDGVLVAHTRQGAWSWNPVRPLFAEDDFSNVMPVFSDSPCPLSHKSVDGSAVAARDGLYVNGTLVFRKDWNSSSPAVLARGNTLCVADGDTLHVWQKNGVGWVRYGPFSTINWLAWDGQYVLAGTEGGLFRIGSGSSRVGGAVWRSGCITSGNKFHVDWVKAMTLQTCQVRLLTDRGNTGYHTFLSYDRWKPAERNVTDRALRWAQVEVLLSQSQSCEGIEVELKAVPLE
jgi:hypothetical protein